MNYPSESEEFNKYVNSYMEDGKIKIVMRDLVDAKNKLVFSYDEDNRVKFGGEAE